MHFNKDISMFYDLLIAKMDISVKMNIHEKKEKID